MLSCDKIRFIGGGRWATIVLTELVKKFPEARVDWVSSSEINQKIKLLRNKLIFKNVRLINRNEIESLAVPDKLIIASHSIQHCADFLECKHLQCDILVEKPLFPNFEQFLGLSEVDQNRIFLNLEYFNAFFIRDFGRKLTGVNLKSIDVKWHDPLSESRGSQEVKYSDIFSSIFSDQLFHVLSILKVLILGPIIFEKIIKDDKVSGGLRVICKISGVLITISLSRFSEKRVRKISVNDGAFSLDFNSTPKVYTNSDYGETLEPLGRMYPVATNLHKFVLNNKRNNRLSLSVKELLPEIKFCFDCEDYFMAVLHHETNFNNNSPDSVSITDPYLVYYAGIRYYRKYCELNHNNQIHHLRGKKGVEALLQWYGQIHR